MQKTRSRRRRPGGRRRPWGAPRGGSRVHRGQSAHSRGVHEDQTSAQHFARDECLRPDDVMVRLQDDASAGVTPELPHGNLALQGGRDVGGRFPPGSGGIIVAPEQDKRSGLLTISHFCGHRGRDVVVNGAHRGIDESVDEHALALLELTDDQHPNAGVGKATSRMPQPVDEIVPALSATQSGCARDQLRRSGRPVHACVPINARCGATPARPPTARRYDTTPHASWREGSCRSGDGP